MDFPTAWAVARATPYHQHDQRCSYWATVGAVLCDCFVLTDSPGYWDGRIDTVVGLCPGCNKWQVDFAREAVTPTELEAVLAEHAKTECPELMVMAVRRVFGASSFETIGGISEGWDARGVE